MAVILTWTTSIHLEMSLNENFIQITNSIFLKNRKKRTSPISLIHKSTHKRRRWFYCKKASFLHSKFNSEIQRKLPCQIAHVNDWISFSSRRILSSDIPIYLFTTLLKIWKLLSFWKIALPFVPWSFNNHIRMPKNFCSFKKGPANGKTLLREQCLWVGANVKSFKNYCLHNVLGEI